MRSATLRGRGRRARPRRQGRERSDGGIFTLDRPAVGDGSALAPTSPAVPVGRSGDHDWIIEARRFMRYGRYGVGATPVEWGRDAAAPGLMPSTHAAVTEGTRSTLMDRKHSSHRTNVTMRRVRRVPDVGGDSRPGPSSEERLLAPGPALSRVMLQIP
jgi:hypothetical protein